MGQSSLPLFLGGSVHEREDRLPFAMTKPRLGRRNL